MKFMDKFLLRIHFLIFAYTAWNGYLVFVEHKQFIDQQDVEIPVTQTQIKKLEKRVEQAETFKANLAESRQRILDVTKDIEQIQKQLPERIKDTEILDLFSKQADVVNINNIFLKPGSVEKRDFYFAKRYELKATGTFLQFLIYFERLANNPRLVNITDLKLKTSASKRNKGRFKLVDIETQMEVFRYNPQFKEETGLDKVEEAVSIKGKTKT